MTADPQVPANEQINKESFANGLINKNAMSNNSGRDRECEKKTNGRPRHDLHVARALGEDSSRE
jgi:hypothetical protein